MTQAAAAGAALNAAVRVDTDLTAAIADLKRRINAATDLCAEYVLAGGVGGPSATEVLVALGVDPTTLHVRALHPEES
jgi:hypothetical protein